MKYYRQDISAVLRFKSRYWKWRFNLSKTLKRSFDVLLASILLVAFSPIFILVSILIKMDSEGPLFFKQERVGLNGKLFSMWKFRSMVDNAEAIRENLNDSNEMKNGVLFKIKHDPRVTKVGRFIRKSSIDELPQLVNVILGDMSLVGPRPHLEREVNEYRRFDYARLRVMPGVTGLWQVEGRSDSPFETQVKLDLQYIETQSLLLDIILLFRTIPAVLMGRGAY